MKLSVVILMVAVSANLAGCFSSNPSESDAKEVVLGAYKQYIDSGDLVVENVKKIDATEIEHMGVKMYEMNVDTTLKYPKGINCKNRKTTLEISSYKCGRWGDESIAITPGFSETVHQLIHFEKNEKGWQGRLGR